MQDPIVAKNMAAVSLAEDCSVRWPTFGKVAEDASDLNNDKCEDVELARAEFSRRKIRYMQLYILYSSLKNSLNRDKDGKFDQRVSCTCDQRHNPRHTQPLPLRKYLLIGLDLNHRDHKKWMKCFGITREFFSDHFKLSDKKSMKNLVDNEVGLGITKFGKSVLSFYRQDFTDRLVIPKICKFPDLLDEDFQNLKAQETSIEKDKRTYLRHVDYYFESLMKGITLMCDKYDLQECSQGFFSSIAQFYSVKADALALKVKLLQLQVLSETYDRETVSALGAIKSHLQAEEDQLERNMNEKSALLETYETVGSVFQDLVKEYAALCVAINNEKWAFQELQKSDEKSL